VAVGRSGAACSAVLQGRQTQSGGEGLQDDPLEGKRSAQVDNAVTAAGIRDQSRKAATRHEARGNAREPDGVTPGGWRSQNESYGFNDGLSKT
jgi:hypothetical protein